MHRHFQKLHEMHAEHHAHMAGLHKEAMDATDEEENPALHAFHKAAHEHHAALADEHTKCAKAYAALKVEKSAMSGADPRELELQPLPKNFSRVVPSISMVPRHGMNAPENFGKAAVPKEFERLVRVDEDSEAS